MTVEEIDKVIDLWQYEQISLEQVIGKILLLLQDQHRRLLKLEATPKREEPKPKPKRPKKR